jgi:hypothetical protein
MTNEEATKVHMVALADRAAELLLGTCKTLVELGPEFEAASHYAAFAERLDEQLFECSQCGWWCGHDEHHEDEADEFVCDECEP